MSILVLASETVWNSGILKFSTAPRKILQRGMILPRRDATFGGKLRFFFESQVLRYAVTLIPFVAAGLTWPSLALPLGSAPALMVVAIGVVELRVLRIPKAKRAAIATDAEVARTLDTLNFRGRKILAQLAAGRDMRSGEIYLVVEQSDLARIPPLTIVSMQLDHGKSRLVELTSQERAQIREGLFDDEFTEHELMKANQRDGVFLRSVSFQTRGVTAHARLDAFLKNTQPEDATA